MKISRRNKEDVQVFELSGEIDFHTSPELRGQLLKVVEKQASRVLVDLKRVSYIDSSGLATFVEALQKMKRVNGQLVLAGLAAAVKSVFEIAKLDSVFLLASSEEEGMKLLTAPTRS